jgi:hypothetical protein
MERSLGKRTIRRGELLLFGCGKNQGVLATNRKSSPNPILPNLSLQDKHNYTILLPNPPFFFYFSQTKHRWFSSYLTYTSSSSPGFFLFFFSSSPSPLTHTSSPGFFLFFFSSSSPSPLTHASFLGFFLLLLPHLSGDGTHWRQLAQL